MLSESRLAIVFRMLVSGISVPGVIEGTGAAGRAAGAGAAAPDAARDAPPPDQDSMSRLMIRPPGPLPATDARSIFLCAAMLRARGLAFTRPPSPSARDASPAPRAWGAPLAGGAGAGGVRIDEAAEAD